MNKELMQKIIEEKVAAHQLLGRKITMQNPSGETMDIHLSLIAMLFTELNLMIQESEADFLALLVTRDILLQQIKKAKKS